jgi:hypothetical protein
MVNKSFFKGVSRLKRYSLEGSVVTDKASFLHPRAAAVSVQVFASGVLG